MDMGVPPKDRIIKWKAILILQVGEGHTSTQRACITMKHAAYQEK